MRRLALALLFAASAAAQSSSQVTIDLSEYDRLRKAGETPSWTVVDTITLAGTFRERNLSIAFAGRAVGARNGAVVIDNAADVTISGCEGAALIARSAKGAFSLIPTAETFTVRCDLRLSGSDRLQMHALPAVLAVRSSVSDGELVAGDEDDAGGRTYSLVRQVTGPSERLAATATGRYRITLLPDATRFRYAIDVHNPNRSTSSLAVKLASSEHLQQIDSAAPYEIDADRYVFSIPPGDSTIVMTGELRGTTFRAPVEATLQYLVIESHPLIRPSVQSAAKRISLAETGLTPQYRGAVAFEIGTQPITWQVTRLEAMRAISYAARSATHRFFVPLDGPILGETSFAIRNEGAAELVLPPEPEPTYVNLQGEPVLMTKDRAGKLTVPLSPGEQTVLVQHRQPFRRVAGFGAGNVRVPMLEVPASHTTVTMTYPEQWIPLYERFATRARLWTPPFGLMVVALALALWLERLLAWLGVAIGRRFAIALIATTAAMTLFTFAVLLILAAIALTVAWIVTLELRQRATAIGGLTAAALIVGFLFMVSNVNSLKRETAMSGDYSALDTAAKASAPPERGRGDEQPAAPAYQGLPAKFDLPGGDRHTSLDQELLRADRPQSVFVIAVSMMLLKWIGFALAAIALALLWRERRTLHESVRARLAAAQEPPPVPA